jgi:hypothetical protein
MPWQMLSGPDLGGGFLFQLTAETIGDRSRLAYHAQEGGMDASGPPKGSPVPFGFDRTTTPCEIGGRDCYHRTFELATELVPKARMSYNRMRFVTAPMLAQQYGGAEIPVRAAVEEITQRLTSAFAEHPDDWFFGGSVAAWLQGAAASPREIDLGADEPGVARIATALSDYLIEPLADTAWREVGPVVGARAYVGTLVSGVRVQWGRLPGGTRLRWTDLGAEPREVAAGPVPLGDRMVRVSRPEYALVRASGRDDRTEEGAVAGWLRANGADLPLLDRLLDSSGISTSGRARVRAAVRAPGTEPLR